MSFKFFGGGGGGGGTDLGDVLVVDSSVAEDGNGLYSTFGAAYTAAAAGDTIICYDSQTAFSESLTFNKTDLGVWAPSTTITGNVTIQQGLDFVFGTIGSNNTTAPLRILASSCRSVTVLGDLRNYSTALEAVLISNSDSTRVELRGRVDTGGSAAIRVTGATSTPHIITTGSFWSGAHSFADVLLQVTAATQVRWDTNAELGTIDMDEALDVTVSGATVDVNGVVRISSSSNDGALMVVASGATVRGTITQEGWVGANTVSGDVSGLKITNAPTTWDHPDIGLPAHAFNMDEASGNLADSVGALAFSAVGTTANLTYAQPAYGPGVGRRKGIHQSRESGAGFETTTSVGSAVSADFTIAFVVNHRDTDTVSTTPLFALYSSAAARSAGHINIHTTTGTTTDHLSVSVDGAVGASSSLRTPINWRWGNGPTVVAVRRSGTTMTLWIDSIQVDSATVTATDYSGLDAGIWRIDASDASTYGQPCTITTLGIWSDALSDAAMAAMVAEDGTLRMGAAA